MEEKQREEEKNKNEIFEKNNPEFCNQYLEDIKQRTETQKKKQDSAEVSRLKGNAAFKKKDFHH